MFYIDINDKIQLKLLLDKDKKDFFNLMRNNQDHLSIFMPRIKETKSVDDTEKVIALFLTQLVENNGFRAGIFYCDVLIGIIGLKYIDWGNRKTEIMYWISKEYLGKGISTECTNTILDLIFCSYKLNKAVLKISAKNTASIRVAEKCGFQLEGVCREEELLDDGFTDIKIYSILRDEYMNLKKVVIS